MGLFDNITKKITQSVTQGVTQGTTQKVNSLVSGASKSVGQATTGAVSGFGNKKETFTFQSIPANVQELQALPESTLKTPFQTAALTLIALCRYGEDRQATIDMLNFLKGPQPLNPREVQFFADRLVGKEYKPFSFLTGATPSNNYAPSQPYTFTVFEDPHSYDNAGYARLDITSSGADSPRQITMRQKGDQWFLWEQFLLSDIRTPAAADPWA
jgi:hypothetical protein